MLPGGVGQHRIGGDERLGWVTFEVPIDTALAKMTMALSSGFSDMVG
jgi:hypothetical protein